MPVICCWVENIGHSKSIAEDIVSNTMYCFWHEKIGFLLPKAKAKHSIHFIEPFTLLHLLYRHFECERIKLKVYLKKKVNCGVTTECWSQFQHILMEPSVCRYFPAHADKTLQLCTLCWVQLPPVPHQGDKDPRHRRRAGPLARQPSPTSPLQGKTGHIVAQYCFCFVFTNMERLRLRLQLPGWGTAALSLRGQRKPDNRQDNMLLSCVSWGRPTDRGSVELTTGKYAASTAICLLMPVRWRRT